MASQLPCVKNDAGGYTFYVSLVSQANTKIMQANPTLAAGDAQIAIDDGAPANLGTLPVVDADFTKRVKVVLSQAETNGDNLTIIFSDAAGAQWCDLTINIQTAAQTFDTIDDYLDTEVAAIKAKTDNLPASPAAVGDIPTAAAVADQVWDEAQAGHVAAGSMGKQVSDIEDLVDELESGDKPTPKADFELKG